jgi:hypothetical protein
MDLNQGNSPQHSLVSPNDAQRDTLSFGISTPKQITMCSQGQSSVGRSLALGGDEDNVAVVVIPRRFRARQLYGGG